MGSKTQNKHCMLSIRSVLPRTNPKPVYAKMWWMKKKNKTERTFVSSNGCRYFFCASTVFTRDMGFCKSWYMRWDIIFTLTLFCLLILAEKNLRYADMTMTIYDIISYNLIILRFEKSEIFKRRDKSTDGRSVGETIDPEIW